MKGLISALGVTVTSVTVAAAIAWAGSRGGAELFGFPVLGWCAALAFGVQWVAFVPAYVAQTERYYDLTGSLTYITVSLFAFAAGNEMEPRSVLLLAIVAIWAVRLGSFLFRRVHAGGGDARFDAIKPSAPRFFIAWTLQGLWVFLTLCAALAAMTTLEPAPLGPLDGVGLAVWTLGFGIEVVADRQKSAFRKSRPGHFIDRGLWAWSRHPNYFGEIVLWVGVALIASSTLRDWQWATMISPVFVWLLLTRISGIPILEKRSDERWAGDPGYEAYKARTSVLVPKPPSG